MSLPSCHLDTFTVDVSMFRYMREVHINFTRPTKVYFFQWFVLVVALYWYVRQRKADSFHLVALMAAVCHKIANPPITQPFSVTQSRYISLWVLLLCLGKVNECSLSLHNHTALFQPSAVLFWCVSLFPMAYPSNQLSSISDFLSSLINWGWPCGPEESPS